MVAHMKTILLIVVGLAILVGLVFGAVKIVTGVGDGGARSPNRRASTSSGGNDRSGGDGASTKERDAPKAKKVQAPPRIERPATPPGGNRKFAFGRATGQYQIVEAGGVIRNPGDIVAKVSSAPKQQVTLSYSIVCSRAGGNAVTSMGQVTARTLVSFKLRKPAGNLLRCTVFTSGQLTKEGKMKTTLVG